MKIKAFGNLDLKLEILPVKSLIIHEQIIPNKAKMLKFQIINWAKLKNPIIVDENNIVLDGNHRATIFKKLGFRNICVCKIDYFNKSIKLKYWFRLIKNFSHFPFSNKNPSLLSSKILFLVSVVVKYSIIKTLFCLTLRGRNHDQVKENLCHCKKYL